MNGFPYARTMYARLILCINIPLSLIHAYVTFRRNRGNINKVIGISSGLSHIHWSIFEDEKGESVELGDVDIHKKSCCDEKFAPKRDGEQTFENNTDICYFNA